MYYTCLYTLIYNKFSIRVRCVRKRLKNTHCIKSVRIRRFSGPYFPAFGRNKSECEKIRSRKTPARRLFTQCLLYYFKFHADKADRNQNTEIIKHQLCLLV